jgi:flagellar basal-body rod protein FlgF
MGVIAQNIANASTTAYKGERILFKEYLEPQPDGNSVSYVSEAGSVRNDAPGPIIHTGTSLDVAINGTGYFAVQTADGTRYTREGHFRLDTEHHLTTLAGDPLSNGLSSKGKSITVPANAKSVIINRDGTVSTDKEIIGRLKLATFQEPNQLVKRGAGLYEYLGSDTPKELKAAESDVQQGMIESSNIEPILEMTRMIEVMRSYQSSQNLLTSDNELERSAIQDITAVK